MLVTCTLRQEMHFMYFYASIDRRSYVPRLFTAVTEARREFKGNI